MKLSREKLRKVFCEPLIGRDPGDYPPYLACYRYPIYERKQSVARAMLYGFLGGSVVACVYTAAALLFSECTRTPPDWLFQGRLIRATDCIAVEYALHCPGAVCEYRGDADGDSFVEVYCVER